MERASPEAEAFLELLHKVRLAGDPTDPLVFLVHGRAGNFDVMSTFKRCIPDHWNIISPQAFIADPLGGFSWWLMDSTSKRSDIEKAHERLAIFITRATEYYELRPRMAIAVGFSQGGALLSLVPQHFPGSLNGVAILAGFVLQREDLAPHGLRGERIFTAHGTEDQTVTIEKSREGIAFLKDHGAEVTSVEDSVGHKVGTAGMKGLKEWALRFDSSAS